MKFLRNGFILLITVIALDQLAGWILHRLYFSMKSGVQYETTFAMTKSTADVVVTGSSKARRNYNTPLIADSLHLTCYNAGHDGQSLLFSYAVVKMMLAHYTPKMIVVEMFPEELYYKDVHYDRLNELLPYYADYPEVREVALMRGERDEEGSSFEKKMIPFNTEKIKLLSQSYRYNSQWVDLIRGKGKKHKVESGYLPLNIVLTDALREKFIAEFEMQKARERDRHIDANKLKSLEGIAKLCAEKNVKLVLVMSPVLKRYDDDAVYDVVKKIALSHQLSFLDYTGDARFADSKYFADNHMNGTGATYFSQVLSQELKPLLAEKK